MTTGEFPDSRKIAHITPIPKVHSPSSSSQYRPISVLLVLSKLFEKILYHRVYSYLTEHNLIDKRQNGFRENHSAELAITTIYDELVVYGYVVSSKLSMSKEWFQADYIHDSMQYTSTRTTTFDYLQLFNPGSATAFRCDLEKNSFKFSRPQNFVSM